MDYQESELWYSEPIPVKWRSSEYQAYFFGVAYQGFIWTNWVKEDISTIIQLAEKNGLRPDDAIIELSL